MTRNQQILAELERLYPNAGPELHFTNPFETLIATMLSAQCTDKQVNKVTEKLFARFQTPAQLAALTPEELEPWIKGCGVYHNKAKNIVNCCRILCERYGGEVPADWEALQTLPGVGRKTANVVLGNAFDMPGFPVDTHVIRVTGRLRWRDDWNDSTPDPVRIEREITACFPPEEWTDLSHRLILHGRATCHARKPDCGACPLNDTCPSAH